MRRWVAAVGLSVCVLSSAAHAVPYEEQSTGNKVLLNVAAGVVNVVPGVSAVYAKRCLPGYLLCKVMFAGISLVAAGEQVLMSGAGDMKQAKAILHRGFGGDWFVTGRHVNGDVQPEPWPEPPPASTASLQP